MPSNVPTIRQTAWISLIPQLLLMGLIIFLFHKLKFGDPPLYGALTYLILSYALKFFVAKDHKQGIKLVKQNQYNEAIQCFDKSVTFFTNNSWIDKYRFLTLLSSSKMSYREMGLCNIAFCYSQINNGQKAKEYYKLTLNEFPDNGLATAGLKMLNSIEKSLQPEN